MEITGKIIQVLPERSGKSARTGTEWKCGTYVLETLDQYPRKMVFEVFGTDRLAQFNIQVGETMIVSFDIDAHEYQGRWFNSIRAWKVDRNLQAAQPGAPVPPPATDPFNATQTTAQAAPQAPADLTAGAPFNNSNAADDLPF